MDRYTYSGEDFDPDRSRGQHTEADPRNECANRRESSSATYRRKKEGDGLPAFIRKPIDFFTSRRTRTVIGIALLVLVCYLTVAALSFLKNGRDDQSVVIGAAISQMADPTSGMAVENVAGPVGAKTSHHLFVEGLGIGSIVLLVYMFLIGLGLLGVRKCNFWSLTFKSLLLAVTLSFVIGLLTLGASSSIPPGGYHGRYINILLISRIGWIGAILVNCLLVVVVITVYLNELVNIYNKYRVKMRTLRDRTILESDRRRQVKEQIADAMSDTPLDIKVDIEDGPQKHTATERQITVPDVNKFTDPVTDDEFAAHNINDSDKDTADQSPVTIEPAQEPSVPAEMTSDSASHSDNPGFTVTASEEIEQGSGLPKEIEIEGKFDPKAELSRYKMPTIDLLEDRSRKINSVDQAEQEENKDRITKTLNDYGIQITKIEATVGPTVTLYEIIPAEGVRIARIKRLEDDIALSLAALGIRIIAPIPGKGTIGIEVPNKDPQTVSIKSILGSKAFQECNYQLPMALGATISNKVYIADLAKMPHLLVAGATGQGKSVGLNTIIASLLYKLHPSELKFVLVDPKMVEFSLYARLEKHYLAKLPDEQEPVVTDPAKVVDTLNSLCVEMDNRYALLKDAGCRSILEYNDKFINRRLNPEKGHRYLPYIVMIVDEFADLIMVSGKSVETPIARIAQKARAVGMHMIIATQRPSTNVITGIIKANFPARIGFRVMQMVDSRTILDSPGANQLIGKGDMLISNGGSMERVQCAFIDTPEVIRLCEHISNQIGFDHPYLLPEPPKEESDSQAVSLAERDTLFDEAARWVVQGNLASTSGLQRRYAIGYNRAGKIMDQMEAAGIVGPSQGGKPRQILIDPTQLEMILDSL